MHIYIYVNMHTYAQVYVNAWVEPDGQKCVAMVHIPVAAIVGGLLQPNDSDESMRKPTVCAQWCIYCGHTLLVYIVGSYFGL